VPDPDPSGPGLAPTVEWMRGLDGTLDATAMAEAIWWASCRPATRPGDTAATGPGPRSPGSAGAPAGGGTTAAGPDDSVPPPADSSAGPGHDVILGAADPAGDRAGHPVPATAVRGPISRPLAESMRALKVRWKGGRAPQLDLDRTVEQYAVTRVLMPLTRPVPERWFEVDLVADGSGAGAVLAEKVDGFAELLRDLGAFRAIRRWDLTFAGGTPRLRDRTGRRRDLNRLRSADHRRLVFVVSDFTDDGWYTAQAWDAVRLWGRSTATVLVGLLPPKLRHLTTVHVPIATARPGRPGTPNTGLPVRRPGGAGARDHLPLPLLALTPTSMRAWADMLMRGDPGGCPTILLPRHGLPFAEEVLHQRRAAESLNPARLLELFDLTAGRQARRIATLSASLSDVSLAVLRFVAHRMVPDATADDVAEVVVSNLFRRSAGDGEVLFFRPGVRAALQRRLMRPDVWRVLDALEQYVSDHVPPLQPFARPSAPDGPGAAVRPFIEASEGVRALLGLADPATRSPAEPPADANGSPPPGALHVRDADPYRLGVHRSDHVEAAWAELPAYIDRDFDPVLRNRIGAGAVRGGFVLLVGGSATGKTRSLLEAVRAVGPDWWLFQPDDVAALTAFAGAPTELTVVWLDDLRRYLDRPAGLPVEVIRTLIGARCLVAGTTWPALDTGIPGQFDLFGPDPGLLSMAQIIEVPDAFSPAELRRAELLATDRRILDALEVAGDGVTQALASGPALVRRWTVATAEARAVVTAALNACRAGARAPLTVAFLAAAAPAYLTDMQHSTAPPDWLEQSLAYATTPVYGAALLTPATGPGGAGYVVSRYLLRYVDRMRPAPTVPVPAWLALLDHHHPDDTRRLADSARVLGNRTPQEVSVAVQFAAVLLIEQGHLVEGTDLLRQRADGGDRAAAARLARFVAERPGVGRITAADRAAPEPAGPDRPSVADAFDPSAYFHHSFDRVGSEDAEIMRIVAGFFESTAPVHGPARALDLGTGDNLYPALLMLPFATRITLCEKEFAHRNWLQSELRAPRDVWMEYWDVIARGRPEYERINQPLDLLARLATIAKGNIFSLKPERFDIATMFFVAERVTTRINEFERGVHSFVGSLMPHAPFAAAFARHSTGFSVGEQAFPGCAVDEFDVERAFASVAEISDIQIVERLDLRAEESSMIVATGRRRI
jgi:hypothetical protein